MADDHLTSSLQESVLTALAFSEDKRASILTAIDPKLFDGPYREIASRLIDYRLRWSKPPAKEHIDDIFDSLLEDEKRSSMYRNILVGMMDQSTGLNIGYITNRVHEFVRRQELKVAIVEASERYNQSGNEPIADEVSAILLRAINKRIVQQDIGVRMDDTVRSLSFLDEDLSDHLNTGISLFDRNGIYLSRKELFLFIGPRGSGKSWWCVHMLKQAMLQRWNALHITLEMSEKRVMQRLMQSFFSVSKRQEDYDLVKLDVDNEKGIMLDMNFVERHTDRTLQDQDIRKYFRGEINASAHRFRGVIVKEFPSGSLTVQQLEAYLDYLEAVEGFIPDLISVDYPDLMKYSTNNATEEIGRIFVDLRGLGQKRNCAILTPTQGNRQSEKARKVTGDLVSKDISKLATCDTGVTYTSTDAEKEIGLGRLFVAKGRNDRDKFTVLITQDYRRGQFVIQSAMMREKRYWDRIKSLTGTDDGDDEC